MTTTQTTKLHKTTTDGRIISCRIELPASGAARYTDSLGSVTRIARSGVQTHLDALLAKGWILGSADPWAVARSLVG